MARPPSLRRCRWCGEPAWRSELTRHGYHAECVDQVVAENLRQMADRHGPWFDRWKRGVSRAVGLPVDDPDGGDPDDPPSGGVVRDRRAIVGDVDLG